ILQKRMVSSLFSITKSLEKRAIRLREALRKREQALEALKELNEYEQEYEDLEDERREEIEDHLLALTTAEHPKEMEIEIRQLEGLVEDAKKIPKDTKAEKFLEFVKSIFDKKPDEKLLVFTEYKDTLTYLAGGTSEGKKLTGILENAGYKLTQIHARNLMNIKKHFEGSMKILTEHQFHTALQILFDLTDLFALQEIPNEEG
ncbi:MAG: hypothetical protein O8C58_05550, partial [Candidatus Methanoperedens sp.]|nr:hypothetical protein [Candidatus Methanoperedens sp.]